MGRFAHIDTRDPAVNISNWFLLVVAILSVLIRLGTKLRIFNRLTNDDYLMVAALALNVGQSIAVSTAVAHGFGDHFDTVSTQDFVQVMKAQYAAFILYIGSLCLSKLSLSMFIRNLTPVHKDHLHAAILQGLIVVLAVIAIFGTAFRCQLPRPWDYVYGKCFNLMSFNYFLAASSIGTDVLIVAQALVLIAGIHATWKKKFIFASIFLSRILVILATLSEIILLTRVGDTQDPTYDYSPSTIASQVVQCASIVTACWGQLKPFLNQLKSNGLRLDGVEYQEYPQSTSKTPMSRSYGRYGSQPSREDQHELVPINNGRSLATVSASPAWDADSQSSQAGIIRETRTWVVTDDETR
ncbi:uncharacterized protein ACLA_017400 [Aspergillus clavatus NRRL 1]|uniref:Rhodopsin domain-containing protein n=1 Tax=Aspergillus clavatus (strain ATCC 1007 / CBS 513.65 / DSM 816 / NCTC 3887 / NRRL 1 / QM 1276 / 107) TaxID=344612 RepID=A1CC25_ASPCL|nr:uncharacterized protein ACLA_017400 [Aspergillus clavatus NRRL 1]EAW13293.1 conserved hypothetical protein [Aspergillus clavatus NRRL 1]